MAVGITVATETGERLGTRVRITAVAVDKGEFLDDSAAVGVVTCRAGTVACAGPVVSSEALEVQVGVGGCAGVSSEQALTNTPKSTQQTSAKNPYRGFKIKCNLYSGKF